VTFGITQVENLRAPGMIADRPWRAAIGLERLPHSLDVIDLKGQRDTGASAAFDRGAPLVGNTQVRTRRQLKFDKPVGFMRHGQREHMVVEINRRLPLLAIKDCVGRFEV